MKILNPQVISPPGFVQAAFDEARALAECKDLLERREAAKGEYKSVILLLGAKLIEARRAMPDVVFGNSKPCYSRGFAAFIDKLGLKPSTAYSYMRFARDPKKLEAQKTRVQELTGPGRRRARVLREVAELLEQAPDLATARRVIQEELDEIK